MTTTHRQLVASALYYASRNWRVFPCLPRGKEPIGKLVRHGCLDASRDRDAILSWWRRFPNANVGVATGNGLIVIDIDWPLGEDSIFDAQTRHGELPYTCEVRTGKGRHLYFLAPPQVELASKVRPMPGIDTRASGGYVIAPPSVHESGRTYIWTTSPKSCPPARLPDEWLALLPKRPSHDAPEAVIKEFGGEVSAGAKARIGEALLWLREASDGERHRSRFEAGKRAGRLIAAGMVERSETIAILASVAAKNSTLGYDKVRSEIEGGVRVGMKWPWLESSSMLAPPPSDDDLW